MKKRTAKALTTGVALFCFILAQEDLASAESPIAIAPAASLERGRRELLAKEYAAARVDLGAAYAMTHDPEALWSLALCALYLQDWSDAANKLLEYIQTKEARADRRAAAETKLLPFVQQKRAEVTSHEEQQQQRQQPQVPAQPIETPSSIAPKQLPSSSSSSSTTPPLQEPVKSSPPMIVYPLAGVALAAATAGGLFALSSVNARSEAAALRQESHTAGASCAGRNGARCSDAVDLSEREDQHRATAVGCFAGAFAFATSAVLAYLFWPSSRSTTARTTTTTTTTISASASARDVGIGALVHF